MNAILKLMLRWKTRLAVILLSLLSVFLCVSCTTLDVPPPNIITDAEVFSSEEGVTAYLARLYTDMPLVQFYMGDRTGTETPDAFVGHFISAPIRSTQVLNSGKLWQFSGAYDEALYRPIWDYAAIRRQNYFFQTIDDYAGKPHTTERIAELKAHTYWIRAFRYFEMVKRYGGVPIVDKVLNYPEQSAEELRVARNREKDCYDFILADCDRAIDGFTAANAPRQAGVANKWDAYALKSRVALYAASIAKYGPRYISGHMYPKGKGITGVVTDSAGYYFRIAYEAAEEVVKSGLYELYKSKWVAGNAAAIEENFYSIFYDRASKEAMFSMQYLHYLSVVLFESNTLPYQVGSKYVPKPCPTVEFVEAFEYADASLLPDAMKSKTGTPFRLDEALLGTDLSPKLYDSPLEVFDGIEPRLRASIFLPGSQCRGETVDIRYGIMPAGSPVQFNLETLMHTASFDERYEGMLIQGLSGMGADATTSTSFYNRKWTDPNTTQDDMDHRRGVDTPWQEFRYTEILMNIAEAVVELKELGEPVSAEMWAEAVKYIHDIRERAGAKADKYDNNLTIEAVRTERVKEFYFENKVFWDYKRWRVFHEKVNEKRWNLLQPIYFWDQKQYYVRRDSTDQNHRYTFYKNLYYSNIPGRENNSLLIGNPTEDF